MKHRLWIALAWIATATACGRMLAETGGVDPGVPDAGPDGALPPPPICTPDAARAWSFTFQSPSSFVFNTAKLDDGFVVLGTFQDVLRFGAVDVAGSQETGFLTRLDACGHPLWLQKLDGQYFSMMVRPDRRIVISGAMTDDGSVLLSTFGAAGEPTSEQKLPLNCFADLSFATGPDGSAVMAGSFGFVSNLPRERPILDSTAASGFACSPSDTPGFYVAKLDPAGVPLFLRTFDGSFSHDTSPNVAALGEDGSVDVTAFIHGVVDFGTGPLQGPTEDGILEPFIVHLDPQGKTRWARIGDGIGGNAIVVAPDGAIVAGADAYSGCAHGALTLLGLDPATGATNWSYCAGDRAFLNGLGATAKGSIVAAGSLDDPTDLSGSPTSPELPIYVATFSDGALKAQQLFGDGNQSVSSMVLAEGGVVIAGANRAGVDGKGRGVIDFGQGKLVSKSGTRAFLAKLPLP